MPRRSGASVVPQLLLLLFFACDRGAAFHGTVNVSVSWTEESEAKCQWCFSSLYTQMSSYLCSSTPETDVKWFEDTLPVDAVVGPADFELFGAFNCNPDDDQLQQSVLVGINDKWVNGATGTRAPNSGMCWCPNCASRVAFNVSADVMRARYRKGVRNNVTVGLRDLHKLNTNEGSNFACLSSLRGTVGYDIADPVLQGATPLFGPTSGATNITITGLHFSPTLGTVCRFRDIADVPVTVLSQTSLSCLSPASYPRKAILLLVTDFSGTIVPSALTLDFEFYTEPALQEVKPKQGSTKGDTQLQITGNFEATGLLRCRFRSAGATKVVSAALSQDNSALICHTPQWPTEEAVELSVSMNDQQYSLPLTFTFKNNLFQLDDAHWLIIGAAAFVAIVVLALVAVWVKHRRSLDGYDKIKEGNMQVDVKDITLGERIGRGTFGEVYKGTWRGAVVAVKKLTATQISEDFVREFEKEVFLMRALRAPNVLQFLGSAFDPPNICIVMEYMSRGSLYGILHNPSIVLEWPLILRMMADTARGMTYLHTCKPPIIHRDLKSHNLLVDEFWKVKVCDFGLSTIMEQASQTMTACGTPCWTAPEVLKHLHYTVKADVYSFGIVLWECMSRSDPYLGMPPFKVIFSVSSEGLRPPVPDWVPPPFAQLMSRCWDDTPERRPEFSVILDDVEEMTLYGWTGQPGQPVLPLSAGDHSSFSSQSPVTPASLQPLRRAAVFETSPLLSRDGAATSAAAAAAAMASTPDSDGLPTASDDIADSSDPFISS